MSSLPKAKVKRVGPSEEGGAQTAYCVKCKAKRVPSEPQRVVNKKGRAMIKGKCPKCGTKMCRFLPKAK